MCATLTSPGTRMTASVAFFNVNVVVFSVVIQYVVLGVYNLIRLSVKGTSIDYYLLQTELIFLSAVYVLALAFFFTEPPPAAPEQPYRALPTTNSDDDSDDDSGDSGDDQRKKRRPSVRGGLFRGDSKDSGDDRPAQPRQQTVVGPRVQGMFDLIVTAKVACGAVLGLLVQSLLTCYVGGGAATCARTWRGDYRVGFAAFYILLTLTALSSLQMCSRRLERSEFSKSRGSTHAFVFFCLYVTFADAFYRKFQDVCSHGLNSAKLGVGTAVPVMLVLNFLLELLYYNRFHAPAQMTRLDLVYELQLFLHLAFYVSYAVTYEGLTSDAATLCIVLVVVFLDVYVFVGHLYGARGGADGKTSRKKRM